MSTWPPVRPARMSRSASAIRASVCASTALVGFDRKEWLAQVIKEAKGRNVVFA